MSRSRNIGEKPLPALALGERALSEAPLRAARGAPRPPMFPSPIARRAPLRDAPRPACRDRPGSKRKAPQRSPGRGRRSARGHLRSSARDRTRSPPCARLATGMRRSILAGDRGRGQFRACRRQDHCAAFENLGAGLRRGARIASVAQEFVFPPAHEPRGGHRRILRIDVDQRVTAGIEHLRAAPTAMAITQVPVETMVKASSVPR